MTSATDKILSDALNIDSSSYSFQMMYMPLNSSEFYNDAYSEVLAVLFTFTIYCFVNMISNIMPKTGTPDEERV